MDDEPEIGVRNFILCRGVTFDATHPDAPYTLHNLLSTVRIVELEVLSTTKPVFAYAEYFGPAGDYEIWIDVVFLGYDGMMRDVEDEDVAGYGSFDVRLTEKRFVHGRCYFLRHIPLSLPGIYEFQLKAAGVFEPLISQRLLVED